MTTTKEKLHRIIFGVDTPEGRAFDIAVLVLILASITILMLESIEGIKARWGGVFYALDWIITGLFTVEYGLRIWTSHRPKNYVFSFFGFVDLFSILPTYLSLIFVGSQALAIVRVLRLLRVFRILKLVQFIGEAGKLLEALKSSSRKIVVFLFFVVIISVFVGTLMYMIEGRENGFTSIPTSIYWAIVTLSTVGYGDISPQTPVGQLLAMFLMVTGYGVLAVPTGLITVQIATDHFNAMKRESEVMKSCGHCGHLDNKQTAKYCSQCGAELDM